MASTGNPSCTIEFHNTSKEKKCKQLAAKSFQKTKIVIENMLKTIPFENFGIC